ncbi:hypothetical protein Hanom_Chr03g00247251 [Helianthus anomalus]
MKLMTQMKMGRFQTFWIQMWKNKPLDESRKTDQTSGTKMGFYSTVYIIKESTGRKNSTMLNKTNKTLCALSPIVNYNQSRNMSTWKFRVSHVRITILKYRSKLSKSRCMYNVYETINCAHHSYKHVDEDILNKKE